MFKRINTGLFEPSEIKNFIKDKIGFVFLYIIFLSVLISIPTFIELGVNNKVDPDIKDVLVQKFQAKSFDGVIDNYVYIGPLIETTSIGEQFYIGALSSERPALGFVFIFEEEKLDIYVAGNEYKSYSYEKLNLESFNFKLDQKLDRDKLKEVIDIIFIDNKAIYNTTFSFAAIFDAFYKGLFLIVMLTIVTSFGVPKVVARYRFIMSAYASTAYFLAILLERLFAVQYISFIGAVVAIIYIRKAITGFFKMIIDDDRKEDIDE